MAEEIPIVNSKGQQTHIFYDRLPDVCPICHTSIYPKLRDGAILDEIVRDNSYMQLVLQCTKPGCENLFIGTYRFPPPPREPVYELVNTAPKKPQQKEFSEEIKKVSPTFVEIYNQSVAAEAVSLTQIHGMGLRKALEFLIKDFLIQQHPTKKSKIEKKFLGNCIEDHINDPNLKECAKRAVWLANDETHYMRQWADKDIEDLKVLIRLTVNWIENVLLTEKYIKSMPQP